MPQRDAVPSGGVAAFQTAIRDTTRLNQLFAILSEPGEIAVVVDRVLVSLSTQFAADVVALFSDAAPPALTPLGAIGFPDSVVPETLSSAEHTCPRDAMQTHTATICNPGSGRHIDPELVSLGVQATCWIPIEGKDRVLGVLLLARCGPPPFSRSDADLLMAMGRRIGLVIERARAEDDRRELEARVRQAEKSESLTRMAAAVAHHFNNKLTAISGHIEFAMAELAAGEDPRRDMELARDEAREATKVGHLMLAYLGQSLRTRRRMDLVAACRAGIAALAPSLPPNVRMEIAFPDEELVVKANPADVNQILTNLIANAVEAGGDAPQVRVSLTRVSAAQVPVASIASPGWLPKADQYACLVISDAGTGMDARTLHSAFDPFFSTKFVGRGLGLPVALGLVKANDGAMAAESASGSGSIFSVFLPIAPSAPPRFERDGTEP
jgi:signal transduction histidine kinase